MVAVGNFVRFLGRFARGLGLTLLCAGPAAAQDLFWDVDRSVEYTTPIVRIAKPNSNETLDLMPAERFRLLREVKQRIEKQSGVTAALMLTDTGKQYPNAYVTGMQSSRAIALNIPMLRLLGDDADAMAAVLGHQYAHIALKHREGASMGERVGASIAITVLMAVARVPVVFYPNPKYVPVGFSGAEEREADEKGMAYATAAGYSTEGGVRAWEGMAVQNKNAPTALISTHSATEERLEIMRQHAAKYATGPRLPAEAKAAPPAKDPDPAAAISLKELQDLEARGIRDQKDARVWQAIGAHYAAFGDVEAALRVYAYVVRLEPANLDALESLGALHAKAGETYRVEDVWQALLKVDAKRAEAYFATYILP